MAISPPSTPLLCLLPERGTTIFGNLQRERSFQTQLLFTVKPVHGLIVLKRNLFSWTSHFSPCSEYCCRAQLCRRSIKTAFTLDTTSPVLHALLCMPCCSYCDWSLVTFGSQPHYLTVLCNKLHKPLICCNPSE